MYFLILIVGVLGFILGRLSVRKGGLESLSKNEMKDVRVEAGKAVTLRTEDRKEKILNMMREDVVRQAELAQCRGEEAKNGITRKSVERLLGVGSTTAIKYINELEQKGLVKQIGQSGRGVYYVLTEG